MPRNELARISPVRPSIHARMSSQEAKDLAQMNEWLQAASIILRNRLPSFNV